MLWLAIHLPALPLQVFTRGMQSPSPIAIVAPPPRATILATTPAAEAAGIHCGQRSASALTLLPELQLKTRAPDREADALAEIATWAERFSPRISLSPPDAVLLEISSCLRLFGGAARIEQALRHGLAELGFDARSACAPTPLAARWFARAGIGADADGDAVTESAKDSSASLHRPASPHLPDSPQAANHEPGSDWLATIDRLPLALLGDDGSCDANTLALLAGLGLHTIGACLPPASPAARPRPPAVRWPAPAASSPIRGRGSCRRRASITASCCPCPPTTPTPCSLPPAACSPAWQPGCRPVTPPWTCARWCWSTRLRLTPRWC